MHCWEHSPFSLCTFISHPSYHMRFDFFVGHLLCSKRFFSGWYSFPIFSKTNIILIQSGNQKGFSSDLTKTFGIKFHDLEQSLKKNSNISFASLMNFDNSNEIFYFFSNCAESLESCILKVQRFISSCNCQVQAFHSFLN